MTFDLISVNVAKPGYLGERRGDIVESGIRKRPVERDQVYVGPTNIEGDGQADQVNHGGREKAVYAYPFDHLDVWTAELEPVLPLGPGAFGENLTVRGVDERSAHIGDIWKWGEALLQICQPRFPCFKLGMATGDPGVVRRMVENDRTGWYLRVLEPGYASVAGPLSLIDSDADGVSVLEAHRARLPGADLRLIERVVRASGLASGMQRDLGFALERDHLKTTQ